MKLDVRPALQNQPLMIWGRRVTPNRVVEVTGTGGGIVRQGTIDDVLVEELVSVDRNALASTPTQDIIAFLARCGALWKSDEYARRRLYTRQLCQVMGYSPEMAEAEADMIASLLSAHWRLHDVLGAELPDRHVMDRWVPSEDCELRAFPRGLVVHLLPGNVPISSVVSLLRAVLTRNMSVAKVAGGDPVTALALALSFLDVDAEHPVARSLSVVYWPKDDPLGARVVGAADAVCVWGGEPAIRWAQQHAAPEAARLVFGPKRSLAMVGREADVEQAATGLAHDVCVYEQRACFSIHQVFVEEPVGPFVEALHRALTRYESILPRSAFSTDELAAASLERLAHEFMGSDVRSAGTWTTIACSPDRVRALSGVRTVFVHPVRDLAETSEWVDADVQTVAAAPWHVLLPMRDDLARRGAARFVELGLSNLFRLGGTHDALQPLAGLVRLVATESPSGAHGKGMILPLDQTSLLENRRMKDLIL
jgi:long-chain-fatty-acyl-CoA reductase